jgi:hypothetical protein
MDLHAAKRVVNRFGFIIMAICWVIMKKEGPVVFERAAHCTHLHVGNLLAPERWHKMKENSTIMQCVNLVISPDMGRNQELHEWARNRNVMNPANQRRIHRLKMEAISQNDGHLPAVSDTASGGPGLVALWRVNRFRRGEGPFGKLTISAELRSAN